jgi:diacylglycerol kinase (ATP)
MEELKKYFFIINPISGKGKGHKIIPLIEEIFNTKKIVYEIHVTKYAGEAKKLAQMALENNFTAIIAVGGDGTVNEIGSVLVNTSTTFGIIPVGSGNGLARDLNIPMNAHSAIKNLLKGELQKIDTAKCNGKYFACTAGIGFDAQMAHSFLHLENRGLRGYIKTFITDFFKYKPIAFQFKINEKTFNGNAFLITIANCKQWGNNFYISPKSKQKDGILEICILRRFPIYVLPILIFRAINKTLDQSKYLTIQQITEIELNIIENSRFHTDGEVSEPKNSFKIEVNPASLNIISGF